MPRMLMCLPLVPVAVLGATTPCLGQETPVAGVEGRANNASGSAQSKPRAGARSDTAADEQYGLQDIIVTAQKRAQDVRDIPSSITAIAGEALESKAVTDQGNLVRLVPGVVLQVQQADTNRIIIRGVSPAPKGAPNQTTQVMIGGVPFVDNYAPRFVPDPLPFDLQTVEVLKGPQGTLFGSGSLNGIVRYQFNQPVYGEFGGRYMVNVTAFEKGDANALFAGALNVPIGEDVALRVAGYTGREPGYNDNITPGHEAKDINWRDRDAIRVSLGVRPGPDWDIHLNYSYEKSFRNGTAVSNNHDGDYTNSNLQLLGFNKYDYSLGELNIVRHFSAFDLVAVTGLMKTHTSKDEDLTASIVGDSDPATTGGYINVSRDRGVRTSVFTQEVRLVSTDTTSPWKWVVGANYSREKARGSSSLLNFSDTGVVPSVIGPPFNAYFSFTEPFILLSWDVRIEELSGFADVTREFFDDKLEISVGGRYYRFKTKGSALNQGSLIELTNFAPPGSGFQILNQADRSEDGFNPKASITFKPNKSILAYVSASRGFRLGGVQSGWSGFGSGGPPPQYVSSDYLWNYEAGLRTNWLDNRLHVDVAAFHLDWKKAQLTYSDPTQGAFYTTNVGAVRGNGVEGSVEFVPVRGLTLSGSAAYTDIKTAVPFTSAGVTIPTGTQWPGSFKWQTAASAEYATRVGSVGLNGGVTFTSLSGGVADTLFKTESNNIGYKLVDMHLGVSFPDSRWAPDISFIVRNLLNSHDFAANLTDAAIAPVPYSYVTYVQPRAFVLQLSKSF